ncbi:hypothetical protein [Aquaticitalea lipolytica]|uniref:hypothetical protein n=1 Tax=Aquaticitalea lipolytica TaxID=1247562 RepID=UPI0024B8AEF0|nr:hypothetical protein [Aquaticitalea lipolytica]
MNKTQKILISLFAIAFISCGRDYQLGKEDLNYIPYVGNEILIFKSDLNRMDTIFLQELRRFNGCYDPLSFSSDDCEGYETVTKITDPNYERYLEGKGLVSIVKSKDRKTYINFDVAMKGSWFYGTEINPMDLNQFDSIAMKSMEIYSTKYNDVKILKSDGRYSKRDNYVERIYWSVSEGFLGLDRRDEKWRLIKKYVP